jgi:hypothetical protein
MGEAIASVGRREAHVLSRIGQYLLALGKTAGPQRG